MTDTRDDITVGLVCYTESRHDCFSFAAKVKEIRKDANLIVGGVHANTLDEQILSKYPFVDIVSRCESEDTVLEVLQGRPLKVIFRRKFSFIWFYLKGFFRNPVAIFSRIIKTVLPVLGK